MLLDFPQTCQPANQSSTCSAIAVSLPVSKCTKFQTESQAMFLFAFIMGYRLLLRGADSSLGNARITWGRAEFVDALLGRTICDHLPKSLMIYCECLFSESPALSFGTAGIFISQLGLSCSRKEKAICKMKWQRQKKKGKEGVGGGAVGGGGVHFTGFSVLQIFLVCDTFCEEAVWRVFETHLSLFLMFSLTGLISAHTKSEVVIFFVSLFLLRESCGFHCSSLQA